jgi:hypothetical protein
VPGGALRASGRAGVVTALALAACLLVAGCSPTACPLDTCPTATFEVRALDDSTVTWSLQGAAPQTATGFVPNPPSDTGCSFDFSGPGEIIGPFAGGPEQVQQGYLYVHCGSGNHGELALFISKLGDYRDWPLGTFTIVTGARSLGADYYSGASTADGCGRSADIDGVVITVTVETATGSRAPYPQLVTSDFNRTFRLDFDTSTATTTTRAGHPCDPPIAAQVSLHLTQTAADYVYDPNAICACE